MAGVSAPRVRAAAISLIAGAEAVSSPVSAAWITSREMTPATRSPSSTATASRAGSSAKRACATAIEALASIGGGRSAQCAMLVIRTDALVGMEHHPTRVKF